MKKGARKKEQAVRRFRNRSALVLGFFALTAAALVARAVDLQVLSNDFLAREADARHLRTAKISAHRGTITDRNGEPLAVSTPVDSIWANPGQLAPAADDVPKLASLLDLDPEQLMRRLTRNMDREFVYLRRHLTPDRADRVQAEDLPGVNVLREYRRFYPAGEVTGHLLGFTDIDDSGQEGLEFAFDHWLAGKPGAKRVLKDNRGRSIEDVESISPPRHGRTLAASIDLTIQYLAYRELKAAVRRHGAAAGSIVVLDVDTGEVLAMVNQPAYNPNDRSQLTVERYRNRAVTDILEPGSSVKPLVMAAALESGRFRPGSIVDTGPGWVEVGAKRIEDTEDLGPIDLTTVLARSSNVGMTKVAMSLEPEQLWQTLSGFGIGSLTSCGFPGESAGLLSHYNHWRPISQATLAYGYGLSVTPLQLARGYAVIGSGGLMRPVSLLKLDEPPPANRVIAESTARQVLGMMEQVVLPGGTGTRADVPGYRIAGKTGTARKFAAGGYSEDRYLAIFAGLAPASDPRLAVVVVIDEPAGDAYYGGQVSAPVFARVTSEALRLLAVPPDDLPVREPGEVVQAMQAMQAAGR
ncbi:MAG TPA: penicillin-binding transpeptidase domain-containing protein [Woeseiaceae bacterium]|nr:penicillin-binding transpeptidase domain-containing protein [Woeseiaceae bacterium]